VIRLLREVRDGISDVGSVHLEIRGVIDLQVIENQITHRVFSWIDCTNLISCIVHIIKRVQLPARDTSLMIEWERVRLVMEATPSLNAKALVGGLRFLMDRLAILRVDPAKRPHACDGLAAPGAPEADGGRLQAFKGKGVDALRRALGLHAGEVTGHKVPDRQAGKVVQLEAEGGEWSDYLCHDPRFRRTSTSVNRPVEA
jgi:hypothetical protein